MCFFLFSLLLLLFYQFLKISKNDFSHFYIINKIIWKQFFCCFFSNSLYTFCAVWHPIVLFKWNVKLWCRSLNIYSVLFVWSTNISSPKIQMNKRKKNNVRFFFLKSLTNDNIDLMSFCTSICCDGCLFLPFFFCVTKQTIYSDQLSDCHTIFKPNSLISHISREKMMMKTKTKQKT